MDVTVVESPYDSGFRDRRMGAGPGHLLERGLVSRLLEAGHDVDVTRLDLGPGLHGEIGSAVELMRQISRSVADASGGKRLPIVLSGNCNAAVGAVSGVGADGTAVLWFDAHGDLNTPNTSLSGFFDGMGYAMLLGHGFEALTTTIPGFAPLSAKLAALAGARDLDAPEIEHIEAWGVESFPPERLRGEDSLRGLERWAGRAERLYVHVDLDVLDPTVLEANMLTVAGGLTLDELQTAIGAATRGAPLAGIGFASYDPAVDATDDGPNVVGTILNSIVGAPERR
jgi:arginase